MSMNPEVKTAWLAALRSGDYQQDKYYLKTTDGFCCLGVLADLYIKAHPDSPLRYTDELYDEHHYAILHGTQFESEQYPPTDISNWAGLDAPNPTVPYPDDGEGDEITLSALNDQQGLNFNEIADLIEAHL